MKHARVFSAGLIAGFLALGGLRLGAGHDEEEGDPRFRQMDANHDGRVSHTEHATAAQAMFVAMDADRNGYLTAAEIDAYEAGNNEATLRFSATAQSTALDRNVGSGAARADGSVSAHEVANARAAPPARPTAADLIRRADRDGDGRLSPREHATEAAGRFTRLDANQDGYLTKAEGAGPEDRA